MTKTEEDWVQMAMGDTCLVAHLLLRLVGDRPPSSRTCFDWTVRGRRSSTRALSRNPDGITKKELIYKPARASPSTPLSWSGATSTSGGPSEESHPCPLDHCHAGRSKATLASSAPTTTISTVFAATPGKRPRQKKKSLLALKDEESLLLKERHCLKQELASQMLRVEEERATNKSLKRLKVGLTIVISPSIEKAHKPNNNQTRTTTAAMPSSTTLGLSPVLNTGSFGLVRKSSRSKAGKGVAEAGGGRTARERNVSKENSLETERGLEPYRSCYATA